MAKKKTDDEMRLEDDLQSLREDIDSEFGPNVAIPLSSADVLSKVKYSVSTGSIVIDKVLAGGRKMPCSLVPFGRQMEINGLPMSGKTTLCAQIAARAQAADALVIVTDTEDRIDEPYWEALGVDVGSVTNLRANTLEEVFDRQYSMVQRIGEKFPDRKVLMIWDSVGGTSSGEVTEGKGTFMERAKKMYGREAKIIGTGIKGLNGLIAKTNICYLYTNHLYVDMDVKYGDKYKPYGGTKLQHFATIRLRLTKMSDIKEEDALGYKQVIGQRVKVTASKNSMAPRRLEKEAAIFEGKGFSNEYTAFDLGKRLKIIKMSGSWGTIEAAGKKLKFQGWKGYLKAIAESPDAYAELLNKVQEAL